MIYFDSAATTLQKPPSVSRAVARAMTQLASFGRGSSRASSAAAELLYSCREEAAALFGVSEPERVAFTFNATHSLNIAIKSLIKSRSRVLISGYEHNAVTRPLAAIAGVQLRVVDTPLFQPEAFLLQVEKELRAGVDAMVCSHISNVFGYILPIEEIAKACARWRVPLIVDASQSAGVLPVHLEKLHSNAGAQGFVRPPGDRTAPLRRRSAHNAFAVWRHRRRVSAVHHAGNPP